LTVFVGTAAACFLALVTSFWGWLPHLADVPQALFLAATFVVAVTLACFLARP
jgi:hypothetical protein